MRCASGSFQGHRQAESLTVLLPQQPAYARISLQSNGPATAGSDGDFMKTRKSAWSRRRLLQSAAMSSLLGDAGAAAEAKYAGHKPTKTAPSIYDELGVRTLINGQGVVTFYSCTLMPPEVHRAMERASQHYVEIVELQRAVGARLAKFAGTEAAMVCSGSAACIAQATAACIAGMDPDKIYRLPATP